MIGRGCHFLPSSLQRSSGACRVDLGLLESADHVKTQSIQLLPTVRIRYRPNCGRLTTCPGASASVRHRRLLDGRPGQDAFTVLHQPSDPLRTDPKYVLVLPRHRFPGWVSRCGYEDHRCGDSGVDCVHGLLDPSTENASLVQMVSMGLILDRLRGEGVY